ncbi:ABC transporter ATP-binding protein [Cellulomonas sp. zg-ZUI188]|uniref:ABC transporter ATP-binding protein n=1 Tax=Cellulomonas fengjieae TaxID=2819978 RepID=A0ABS3SDX3_9CELL|nr:ABC transporter ATP-binding protein [Cellulomonas fengjieae]QVI67923.1 ABC transporter ATP-binding protein [Cellulomonas fengjieae]
MFVPCTDWRQAVTAISTRRVTTDVAPVVLEHVTKTYGGTGSSAATVRALDDVTLELPEGSFTAVMGPSGSGKSTLLHCAAGLDAPTTGRAVLAGHDLTGMSEDALTRLRRDRVAFVFQAFNLIPTLTAAQNVELPGLLAGRGRDPRSTDRALARVGLGDRRAHRPGELSGGQQQRVAIARALAVKAAVLFADEPTGALDTGTAARILELLRTAGAEDRQTIMMTTHDPVAAAYADTVIFLVDGRIVERMTAPSAEQVAARLSRLPGDRGA